MGIYGLVTPCLRGRLGGGAGLMAARSSAVKRFRSPCEHPLASGKDEKKVFIFGLTGHNYLCRERKIPFLLIFGIGKPLLLQ